MKKTLMIQMSIVLLCYCVAGMGQGTFIFKKPVVKIDFGSSTSTNMRSAGLLQNYQQIDDSCPDDGFYTFKTSTSNCFGGNWIDVRQDHTPGDVGGNMMIVNAAENPGVYFLHGVSGLISGAHYELETWLVNICKRASGCTPTPPNISISIFCGGKLLAAFRTGNIAPTGSPDWQRFFGRFTMPSGMDRIEIRMRDDTAGGCGNDFAMDDISIREFLVIPPALPEVPKKKVVPLVVKKKIPVKKIATKPVVSKTKPTALKKTVLIVEQSHKPVPLKSTNLPDKHAASIPTVLLQRDNPIVKTIETGPGEMLIELYDNGAIDGDTVTVYHNNKLVISRAGISEKPLRYRLKVDAQQPHHELIMVADNTGSIPPNTSLMIVTVNEKRYEIFISSSEEKNARILIDLKE